MKGEREKLKILQLKVFEGSDYINQCRFENINSLIKLLVQV
jgi:hypothetical protein